MEYSMTMERAVPSSSPGGSPGQVQGRASETRQGKREGPWDGLGIDPGRTMAILDTETTGLYADRHRILSVGAVIVRRGIIVDDRFSRLVWQPEAVIRAAHPKALEVNGYEHERWERDGIPEKDAADDLRKFLRYYEPEALSAYNIQFDRGFLIGDPWNLSERHGSVPWGPCVMLHAATWFRARRIRLDGARGHAGGTAYPKLSACLEEMEIEHDAADLHDSLVDAVAAARVWLHMRESEDGMEAAREDAWIDGGPEHRGG